MAKYIGIKAILAEFYNRIQGIALLMAHPVGSIYMSTDPTDPETLFGGKWQKLPDGVFIRNAGGDAGTVGQTQVEALPNIKGELTPVMTGRGSSNNYTHTGVFEQSTHYDMYGNQTGISNMQRIKLKFDASSSSSIYRDGAHVTPYNMAVYMWRRTS